jgi:hypothetical protein
MKELVIVFEGNILGSTEGEIFFDNIILTSQPAKYLQVTKEIRNKTLESKKKFTEMAQLPEDEFLELISRKTFNYFWNEVGEETGFVKDRTGEKVPSSIAATGFGLAAICIADSRNWITHQQAYDRVKKTLTAVKNNAARVNGVYYHFIDKNDGYRVWKCEVSSVDTALLLGGVITAEEYFKEKDIKKLCRDIYSNIDWKWMMEPKSKGLYMGWDPEGEFSKYILWDMFGEEMLMYVLAMGAPKDDYAIPADSWDSFRRPVKNYKGYKYIFCESESMFTYQYSHAFIDFRNKHDKYADYWKNSYNAINASIAFSEEQKSEHKTYQEGFWGISASDGPDGYKNYGATIFTHDGTVAPYALCGAVPYVPEKSIAALRNLMANYGEKVWDEEYGFVSSFNLNKDWFSTEHVGIDLGISLLMIENYRTEFIWNHFNKNKYVKNGMNKAGFKPGTKELELTVDSSAGYMPGQKKYYAKKVNGLEDKFKGGNIEKFNLDEMLEYGEINKPDDLNAKFAFVYDDEHLYMIVDVVDNVIHAKRNKDELYKDDSVELFFSRTETDILEWGNKDNFQIGLAPTSLDRKPAKYSFFQKSDLEDNLKLDVENTPGGYTMYAAIKWELMKMKPEKGNYIGMSVAIHDIDKVSDAGKKVNWFFKNTPSGIKLGKLILE